MPILTGAVVALMHTPGMESWSGLLCRVTEPDRTRSPHRASTTWLTPLTRRPDGYGLAPFSWMIDNITLIRPPREDTSQMPIVTDRPIAVGDRVVLKPVDDYADNAEAHLSRALRDAGGLDGVFTVARTADSDRRNPLVELVDIDGGYYAERFTFAPDAEPLSEDTDVSPDDTADVSAPFAVGDKVVLKSVDEHAANRRVPHFIHGLTFDGVFTVTSVNGACLTLDGVTGTHFISRFKAAPDVAETPPAPVPAPPPFAVGDRVVTVTRFSSDDVRIGATGTITRVNPSDYDHWRHDDAPQTIAIQIDGETSGGYFDGGEYIAIEGDDVNDSPMSAWQHVTHEFAIRDRVRVVTASHIDTTLLSTTLGVIEQIDPDLTMGGTDEIPHPWLVRLDNNNSVWASKVVLSAAPRPEGAESPLADWERELLDLPTPEVVSYSQAALDEIVARARAEASDEARQAAQGAIEGLTNQARQLQGALDEFKRVVANKLLDELTGESWDRSEIDRLLSALDMDPSVYIDEPVWEFKVTETTTYTVRATRGDSNRQEAPSIDYIRQSITHVGNGDVEMDSDWLDIEMVDDEQDWDVVYGSVQRAED